MVTSRNYTVIPPVNDVITSANDLMEIAGSVIFPADVTGYVTDVTLHT